MLPAPRHAWMIACVLGLAAPSVASDGLLNSSNRFIENRGQWDARAQFLSRSQGVNVWVTDSGVVYDFQGRPSAAGRKGHVVRMEVVGARPSETSGVGLLPGKFNYFIGANSSDWVTGVRSYREAATHGILPGVAARWYVQSGRPRYDFIVSPGADPGSIGLRFKGAQGVGAEGGTITLGTSLGLIRQTDLRAYQTYADGVRAVPCVVQMDGSGVVRFRVGRYDPLRPLVIDPLLWGAFLGGATGEYGDDVAVDAAGDIVVAGSTFSEDFPVTEGAYSIGKADTQTAFVAKVSSDGSTLHFGSFLGGEALTWAESVAVDSLGRICVAGQTWAKLFPTTPGAIDRRLGGVQDSFFAVLSNDGSSLLTGTYIGGAAADRVADLAVVGNDIVLAGYTTSSDYLATPGAFGAGSIPSTQAVHGFAMRLAPGGTSVVYRALFKGGDVKAVDLDGSGNLYVGGLTRTADFPSTAGALSTTLRGMQDGFLCKLDPAAATLSYSTFIGGDFQDSVADLAVRGAEVILVGAQGGNFPIGTSNSGAYLLGLNAAGSALTFGRNVSAFTPEEMALNAQGEIFLVGSSGGIALPVSQTGFDRTYQGIRDGALLRFSPDGSYLQYGTYLNGDSNTRFFVTLKNFAEGNSSVNPEKWHLAYGDAGNPPLESTPNMVHTADSATVQANLNGLTSIPDAGVTVAGPDYNEGLNHRSYIVNFVGVPAANVLTLAGVADPDPFILDSIANVEEVRINGQSSGTTECFGVAVNAQGDPVVCGTTDSGSVPGTLGSFSPLSGGAQDAFIATFDARPLHPVSVAGVGGDSGIGGFLKAVKVTMNRAAPENLSIQLGGGGGGLLRPPPSVALSAGATSVTLNIITRTVTVDTNATLFATYNGKSVSCVIKLKPGGLLAHSGDPQYIRGNSTFSGYVTLSAAAPSGGRNVDLVETSSGVAVPSPVLIPQGATSANYQGTTGLTFSTFNATITARLGSMAIARTITVNP